MKCKNCDAALQRNVKFCPECGAQNAEFRSTEDRLADHEKEISEIKKKLTPTPAAAPGDPDSTLDSQL